MKKNLIFMIGIFILFLSAVYADYPKTEISRAGGLGPDYSNEVEYLLQDIRSGGK